MRHALWVDIREPRGDHRRLLFDAEPPDDKRFREARLREMIGHIWPDAEHIHYSRGVGRFEVGPATAVAHFAPVSADADLLPVREAGSFLLGDDNEAHLASSAPSPRGVELQLRLL
jgi:hypothetical protein